MLIFFFLNIIKIYINQPSPYISSRGPTTFILYPTVRTSFDCHRTGKTFAVFTLLTTKTTKNINKATRKLISILKQNFVQFYVVHLRVNKFRQLYCFTNIFLVLFYFTKKKRIRKIIISI